MSRRNVLVSGVLAAVFLTLSGLGALPASAESDYCNSQQGMQDPRCKAGYCDTREGAQDPYCWDPHYCERHPGDPICQKQPVDEEKKERCVWYVDGAPVGSVVPVLRQSNPGPHAVRLDCPNHALKDWSCKEKGRDQTPIPETGQKEPACQYHGATVNPTTCAATFLWTVTVPDFNTWTVEMSATTYKVRPVADVTGLVSQCVGPVDWNTSAIGTNPDGTPAVKCVLENEFLAKDALWKSGGTWYHYHQNEHGEWEYHTHPNVASMPDDKIDGCDLQHYSIQWRQWN